MFLLDFNKRLQNGKLLQNVKFAIVTGCMEHQRQDAVVEIGGVRFKRLQCNTVLQHYIVSEKPEEKQPLLPEKRIKKHIQETILHTGPAFGGAGPN